MAIGLRLFTCGGSQCEIVEGDLPRRQARLVLAWAELHQDELMADW
nr:DUF4160 domain-containing protein [Pelobacter propionicus]